MDFSLMLLQTNSYVVPREKQAEHARLMRRFRQTMARLGCDAFQVFEQVGPGWSPLKTGGRFIQMIQFRDRKHHQQIQAAERGDAAAQQLIKEFCDLIDFPYQQEQGLFASGFYTSVLTPPLAGAAGEPVALEEASAESPQPDSEPPSEPPDQLPARDFTATPQPDNAGNSQPR